MTRVGRGGWLVLAGGLLLSDAATGRQAAPPTGVVQLSRELRAGDRTGDIREVDLDRIQVTIEEAPPLGEVTERRVPRAGRRRPRPAATLDRQTLMREVKDRFQDFELCRVKVARLRGLALDEVKAGTITALWTILPTGDTRGTVVLERSETALGLMKCARRHMNGWRFTPPVGGPVEVEFDYDFSRQTARKS